MDSTSTTVPEPPEIVDVETLQPAVIDLDTLPPPPPVAPYGYTKAGKARKRPAPDPAASCPVKGCKVTFKHRAKPRQAMWQHLLVYFRPTHLKESDEMGRLHREAHAKAKAEVKNAEYTEEQKKEAKKQSQQRWLEKEGNRQLAKDSATIANLKAKIRRRGKAIGREFAKDVVDRSALYVFNRDAEKRNKKN